MNKHPRRTFVANSFGALGYIGCLALWGWSGILFVPKLLENKQIEQIFIPPSSEAIPSTQVPSIPSSAAIILAVVITAIVIIVTLIAIARAPKAIVRTSTTVTTKVAKSALPLITQHQKISPAKAQRLTAELIKIIKLLLVTLPVATCFIGIVVELPLSLDLALLVSSTLAIGALLCFCAQYITARIAGVRIQLLI
jgi:hypothetical protein